MKLFAAIGAVTAVWTSATPVSLIPGGKDPNPLCYECPNAIYAAMVMKGDPLVHNHTKVDGTCASQGFDKDLGKDPVFKQAELFLKSKALVPATPVSLIPGGKDLNPLCYECPNAIYAAVVMKGDPLVHNHTKVDGTCASQGFDKDLGKDPVFKQAELFLKSKALVRSQGSIKQRLCPSEGCNSVCFETELPIGKCLGGRDYTTCSTTGASYNDYDDPSCSGTPMTKTFVTNKCLFLVEFDMYAFFECDNGASAPASINSTDHRGANTPQSLVTLV